MKIKFFYELFKNKKEGANGVAERDEMTTLLFL